MKLLKKEYITDNAFKLILQKPESFNFDPGQFLTITAEISGENITRAYSIASLPTEKHVMLYIKLVQDGKMTTYLNKLKEPYGDLLVKGPFGVLTPDHIGTDFLNIIFLVAGSGISPVRPLAHYYDKFTDKNVYVVHQEREEKLLMFKEDFKSWRINYMPILSREKTSKIRYGHFQDYISEIIKPDSKYVVIGTPRFVTSAKEELKEYDVLVEKW